MNKTRAIDDNNLQINTEQNRLSSPFLRLSSEIHNTIYHYALGDHEIYALSDGPNVLYICPADPFAWTLSLISSALALQLPLVCRQIRFDLGAHFVFKTNTFGSVMPEHFYVLMNSLTPMQRQSIETVKTNYLSVPPECGYGVHKSGARRNMLFAGLKKLGGLKKVGKKGTKALVEEVLGRDGVVVEIESIC
jgi:hypothetical protein